LQRSLHWWQFNRDNHDNPWLVVDLPLWKILVGMIIPNIWKVINSMVPNHQPESSNHHKSMCVAIIHPVINWNNHNLQQKFH
jgi:hypothetical protein